MITFWILGGFDSNDGAALTSVIPPVNEVRLQRRRESLSSLSHSATLFTKALKESKQMFSHLFKKVTAVMIETIQMLLHKKWNTEMCTSYSM